MNDFTKNELKYIAEGLANSKGDDPYLPIPERYVPIIAKIKSLIANYCDHDYMTFLQDQNNEPFIEKCIQCHSLRVWDNNNE